MANLKTDFFGRQRSASRSIQIAYVSIAIALAVLAFGLFPVGMLAAGLALLGSGFKSCQLRRNAYGLPESVGGTLIFDGHQTITLNDNAIFAPEKQLINITIEMALASQLPTPNIWVLRNENDINAFVVANAQQQSQLVLTQGAVQHLSRDELQALIAYQFGQIKTGDAYLHQRLLGIYYGLEMTGLAGYYMAVAISFIADIFENFPSLAVLSSIALWLFGLIFSWLILPFLVLGFGGLAYTWLMRKIIIAGTTERADAHSVQFTRQPAALLSILEKLSAPSSRKANRKTNRKQTAEPLFTGKIKHKKAFNIQYMCFVEGHKNRWVRFKPTLAERIAALRDDTNPPTTNQSIIHG